MKKYRNSMIMLTLVTITLTVKPAFCGNIKPSRYYTWGIDDSQLNIPDGSIVTQAVLTFENIANWDTNLQIHLVDNPPLGFVENIDNSTEDFFLDFEGLINTGSHEIINGNAVFTLGNSNDQQSWTWNIFLAPFDFTLADSSTVSYSSALLELIDYAGNDTPFGFAFDPQSNYSFDSLTLELTIESFHDQTTPITQTFQIQMPTSNYAPTIQQTGDKIISENSQLTFMITAYDPDGDTLIYSATNLPTGATFNNQTFLWTPDNDQAGIYLVTFTADDGLQQASTTTQINVNDTARINRITITGPDSLDTNTTQQYTCTAWFDDGTSSVVSPAWSTSSESIIIDNLGMLTTPDIHSETVYTITARHGQHIATHAITVSCNNNAPVMTPIATKTISEGKTLTFTIAATDPDGDLITFNATGLPQRATFDPESRRFQWKVSFTQAGLHQITFTASDNCLTATQTVTIIVNERTTGKGRK